MTVEMPASAPFVWPEAPTDFSPWDQEAQKKAEEAQDKEQDARSPRGISMPKPGGEELRKQAEELLAGKRTWRPGWTDWDVTGRGDERGDVGAQVGM